MDTARHGRTLAALATAAIGLATGLAAAQDSRLSERDVNLAELTQLRTTTRGEPASSLPGNGPVPRGPGCGQVSTHTNASFTGGTYSVQAGIVEGEMLAVSYTIPADAFPIRIDAIEFIWATSGATVPTTTQYSLHVWDGLPTGNMLVEPSPFFSSDQPGDLPPIVLPPGTSGVNVQVSIDPGDPDQLYILNNSGTNTFSVGVRIEELHDQAGCTSGSTSSNAFPVTDQTAFLDSCSTNYSQVQSLTQNWLYAINCGGLACPPGWARFQDMIQCCRPHGDWVIRVTWSSIDCQPGVGACCGRDGSCFLGLQSDCIAVGGAFQGEGSTCSTVDCPQPDFGACCLPEGFCFEDFDYSCADLGGAFQGAGTTCDTTNCAEPEQACCFANTGSCQNATASVCEFLGGVPQGFGTSCATFVCFPTGACCLPNGTCQDGMSPEECTAAGGTFQGNDTVCSGVTCPQPQGACCLPNGNCMAVTQSLCNAAGGSWLGFGSDCDDCNGATCVCEFDGNDAQIDVFDLLAYLDDWFASTAAADIDGVTGVDVFDLLAFLDCWFPGSAGQPCP